MLSPTIKEAGLTTKKSDEKSSLKISIEKNNPFPGLRPFRYEESHLFFGREGQIDEVVKKLTAHKFVAVIGTSGIGKSSFMYCGLLPILYGGFKTDSSSQWDVVISRPGTSPIKNLSDALSASDLKQQPDEENHEVIKNMNFMTLRGSSTGLVELVKPKFNKEQKNYLIFIDQFEELFRFKDSDINSTDEANAFIKLLTEAVAQKEVPIYVVITMRSDFVGDCSQFPKLTNLINDSQFLIPQMQRDEKKQAILGPIGVMGGKIEDRLVQQILNDVGDNADALPIMQHALMRTWDYWQRNGDTDSIDLSHYETIGGMNKALSVHANEAYNELNEEQKKICEKIFKTITEKGEEGRGVRRPAKLKDIAAIANAPVKEVMEVVDHFRKPGKTLLMPPYSISLNEESIIDISHESLMRIWVMLNKWVDEESESVKMYLRLAEAAEMHQLGKAGLWRPPDLQIALNWQANQNPSSVWGLRYHNAYERTMLFLEFSKKEFERERIMKEKMQRRRLIAARITAIVLGLGAVVAFLFFIYGEQQRREADKQRAEAKKQFIVAQEQAKIAKQESEKARESEIKALSEAERALKNEKLAKEQKMLAELATKNALIQKARAEQAHKIALTEERKAYNLRMLSIAKSMAIKSVSLTDKEQKGLVAQQAYQFNKEHGGKELDPDIFDAMYNAVKASGDSSFKPLRGHSQNVRALATTLTGTYIYSAGSDGKINRWDPKTVDGSKELIGETPSLVHKAIAVSPDNKYLISGGDYMYLQLFDLSNIGSKPKVLKTRTTETWFLGFSKDSKTVISVGNDKKILSWDIESGTSTPIAASDAKINTVAMSPIGNYIIVGKGNGEISVIDLDKNNEVTLLYQDNTSVVSLAFSKNGLLLAAGNEKGVVRIWDASSKTLITSLTGHTARVNNIRFSNDGQRLATGSFDKTVRIWNVLTIFDPPIVLRDHDDWVWSIEFSPDGHKLLAGCKDNKIKVWPTNVELMKDILCNKANRNLNGKEWEQFVGDDIEYQKTCLDKPNGNGIK